MTMQQQQQSVENQMSTTNKSRDTSSKFVGEEKKVVNFNDVHILNEIVKENKNSSVINGGRTSGGVRYSASELQFYKDHITGVKGERRERNKDTNGGF